MRITACVNVSTGANPTGYFTLDDGRTIHESSMAILKAHGLLENGDEIETFRGEFYRELAYSLDGANAVAILSEETIYKIIKGDGIIAGKEFTLDEFEIPEGVKFVGKGGFQGLVCLKTLVIPSSVEVIEEDAFNGCLNLTRVTFRKGLRTLQHRAFANTALEVGSVSLPDTLDSISTRNVFPKSLQVVYVDYDMSAECRRALGRSGITVANSRTRRYN